MKKFLVILIITNVCQFVYTQKIPFKIIDGDIEWQETYEEDLKIKPQTIYFTEPKKKGGQYINKCFKADLFVHKKNGITTLKIRNFMFLIPPAFPEEERVSNIALNKNSFKELFLKRDAKILDGMVKKAIDNLLFGEN
tara:strand:- start:744 stop:1157 length:414 start_codon:yes stop_codon:yes gene_type:complete